MFLKLGERNVPHQTASIKWHLMASIKLCFLTLKINTNSVIDFYYQMTITSILFSSKIENVLTQHVKKGNTGCINYPKHC